MKRTPIYAIAQNLNAQFVEQAGWCIPASFSTLEAEVAAARERVTLADLSANGKLAIQGRQAASCLQAVWNISLPEIGLGRAIADGQVYRLRGDMFFVSTSPGQEAEVSRVLTAAAQSFADLITVTDVTHGRAELRLVGPDSAKLLSRLCSLDFSLTVFPNLTAKQSSLAKTNQLIIRRDLGELPAFSLVGASSLGAYLWETLMQVGRDLAIAPMGQVAAESL